MFAGPTVLRAEGIINKNIKLNGASQYQCVTCLDPQVEEVPTVAVKVLIVQKMTRETNQKSVDAIGKS